MIWFFSFAIIDNFCFFIDDVVALPEFWDERIGLIFYLLFNEIPDLLWLFYRLFNKSVEIGFKFCR